MMYNTFEVRESSITPENLRAKRADIKIAPPPIIYAEKAFAETQGLLALYGYFLAAQNNKIIIGTNIITDNFSLWTK